MELDLSPANQDMLLDALANYEYTDQPMRDFFAHLSDHIEHCATVGTTLHLNFTR